VLDKDGNKMSKRLGNAVNPFEAIDKYGSDPLRWYMIVNSAPWDNLKFDPAGVQESARKMFATLYNTYSFFALYANVDNFDREAPEVAYEKRPEIDRWILSLLNSLILEVERALDDYEPTRAGRAINDFVTDNLSNWYVRLNRKRFWGGGMTEDKLSAYQTLYKCLTTIAQLIAPIAPFYADRLYADLTGSDKSVHLSFFPKADASAINADLEKQMQLAQTLTSMVLALRRKVNIKVRQPLSTIMVPVLDDAQREMLNAVRQLVLNEVNVKDIRIVGNDEGILVKRVKPDFKKLGPKHGKQMKAVAAAITALDSASIAKFEKDGRIDVNVDGQVATIDIADVEIISEDIPGWLVANEGSVTVALDVTITPELQQEGLARDIINRIQNIRKSRNYEITDRINIAFAKSAETSETIANFGEYIGTQVLANTVSVVDALGDEPGVETLDIDGTVVVVNITLNK
jgi:isoleucyl-tRNA synthetase